MQMANPSHPGEILKRIFLDPLGISISKTSQKLGITRNALSKIINGKAGISPIMAFRLAKAFDTTPEFWIDLQVQYDMAKARNSVNLDKVEVIYKSA